MNGFHFDEIDDPDKTFLGADGQLNGHGVAAQTAADLLNAAQEVRAGTVHLVDEGDAGHAVLIHLAPHRLGLRLHPRHGAVHGDGRIQHAQATLHFDGEIDVARGIDDVDAMLGEALIHPLPEAGGCRGRDGDAAFLFLLHVVHDSRAVVNLADFVRDAGVEQNTLRRGGFPRVDMSRNTDVSVSLDGRSACHITLSAQAQCMRRDRLDPARYIYI